MMLPAPELDSMIIAASGEYVSDRVPGQAPDNGLVGGLHHTHLLVRPHLTRFHSDQDQTRQPQI